MGYSTSFSISATLRGQTATKPVPTIDSIRSMIADGKPSADVLAAIDLIKASASQKPGPSDETAIIAALRAQCDGARYALDEDGETAESSKWYEHETDLRSFSKDNPDWLITLKGEGEEAGDIWIKHFLAGKMQTAKAAISFDAFDPAKLK